MPSVPKFAREALFRRGPEMFGCSYQDHDGVGLENFPEIASGRGTANDFDLQVACVRQHS